MLLKDLPDNNKRILDHLRINICDNTQFNDKFANWLNSLVFKSTVKDITITDSKIVTTPFVSLKNSVIKNCKVMYSPMVIEDSTIENVNLNNCNYFSIHKSKIKDAVFNGGSYEIVTSNPLMFNFDNGTIFNVSENKINFFGEVDTYEYFMANIEKFPYCEYSNEIESIYLMGYR